MTLDLLGRADGGHTLSLSKMVRTHEVHGIRHITGPYRRNQWPMRHNNAHNHDLRKCLPSLHAQPRTESVALYGIRVLPLDGGSSACATESVAMVAR